MMDTGISTTVDLVSLSDAFRRHARFSDPETVRSLVRETRLFAALLTHYRPEYPGLAENGLVARGLKNSVEIIAQKAAALGADRVVLPISGGRGNLFAAMVRRDVLKGLDLPVGVTLRDRPYATDLSALGPVDRRFKTVLDEGIRGLIPVVQKLRGPAF